MFTVYGFHLMQVTDQQAGHRRSARASHSGPRGAVRTRTSRRCSRAANSIYEDLRKGESFDSLATRYNTDPAATKNGDLGWLRVAELPEFFRDVLADLKPGDVSQVMRETAGFRIVKLIERDAERPYEFAEIKEDIKRLYDQQMFSKTYEDYIADLRKKFPVEMRI